MWYHCAIMNYNTANYPALLMFSSISASGTCFVYDIYKLKFYDSAFDCICVIPWDEDSFQTLLLSEK